MHLFFSQASYVKWLEMAGARVVPLPFDRPDDVSAVLPFINGALFTGGGTDFTYPNGTLTPFSRTASLIFNESVRAAAAGETWPLWGTCLGFQLSALLPLSLVLRDARNAPYRFCARLCSFFHCVRV
jgi:gamma-glutamyl hydrolase